mgnify:CR=1 FL=1
MIAQEANRIISSLGQREAEQQAYYWYNRNRTDIYSPDITFLENGYIQPGKINIFKYNPKHKDVLDYWDKRPVVLCLGNIKRGNSILEMGINLNFIPTPYKWYILDTIQKTYSGFFQRVRNVQVPTFADKQPLIKYNYSTIRALLASYKVGFALRTYIPSRRRSNYIVNYNNWLQAGMLSIEDFEGISYSQMIQEYRKYNN